jgi:hypothetical protein
LSTPTANEAIKRCFKGLLLALQKFCRPTQYGPLRRPPNPRAGGCGAQINVCENLQGFAELIVLVISKEPIPYIYVFWPLREKAILFNFYLIKSCFQVLWLPLDFFAPPPKKNDLRAPPLLSNAAHATSRQDGDFKKWRWSFLGVVAFVVTQEQLGQYIFVGTYAFFAAGSLAWLRTS